MKNKKTVVLTIVFVLCIVLVSGAVYFFNSLFPKADAIAIPEFENIISVSVSTDEDVTADSTDTESILLHIKEATPTRRQSVNDYPTVTPYYKVVFEDSERVYHYFIYEEGNTIYIELPYEGIYKANAELINILSKYFP